MTLVTRFSVAFLVALALALGGFSACLYYVAGLRLRLALDQELEATLDRFPDRPAGETGRVTWAIFDEAGRRTDSAPGTGRPMVLDGRDLGPLAIDLATTINGPDGLRCACWRGRSAAAAAIAVHPRLPTATMSIARDRQVEMSARAPARAAIGALECSPHGHRSSRSRPRSDRWRSPCL